MCNAELVITPNCIIKDGVDVKTQEAGSITFASEEALMAAKKHCALCLAGNLATQQDRMCVLPNGFEFSR